MRKFNTDVFIIENFPFLNRPKTPNIRNRHNHANNLFFRNVSMPQLRSVHSNPKMVFRKNFTFIDKMFQMKEIIRSSVQSFSAKVSFNWSIMNQQNCKSFVCTPTLGCVTAGLVLEVRDYVLFEFLTCNS